MAFKLLEDRILNEGRVLPGHILKIDNFLNHQIDPLLIEAMGKEFARLFAEEKVTKVLTVEASGIVIACETAKQLGVKMLFAKKANHHNVSSGRYSAPVRSYTTGNEYSVSVSSDYLSAEDRVLIIDDFLAMGEAARGLLSIVEQAGATAVGLGFAVEKGFQPGGAGLREAGYHVESLAIVEDMTDDSLTFRH